MAWDSRAWHLTGKLTGTTVIIFQWFVTPLISLNGARLEGDTVSLLSDQYCFLQSDLKLSLKSDLALPVPQELF